MDLVATIARAAHRIAEIARRNPAAPVTRYPGWTMLDLLVHTGSVHRRTIAVVRTGARHKVDRVFPLDESPATVLPWFEAGAAELVEVLQAADPAAPVWGFGPHPSVGGWILRMALETDVHRHDAEVSVGQAAPLDPDLACAGIEEFVAIWGGSLTGLGGASLTVRSIDRDRAWTLLGGEGGVGFGEATAAPVATGTASDLYLWMLGRPAIVGAVDGADLSSWDAAFRALPDARR